MNIGEKLVKYRKEKNLTQVSVAKELGISKSKLSKWEKNEENIDINYLSPLCKLYNITPNDLLNDEVKKTNVNREEKYKTIKNIITIVVFFIYLYISFKTMAWYLTWIIWIIYALIIQIIKLIFQLGDKDE